MAIDSKLETKLQALPMHSPKRHARVPLDPRLAKKFLQSKGLTEESRGILQEIVVTSKWQPAERATYAAVASGYTTVEELETVTGLTLRELNQAVSKLQRKGFLKRI